MLFWGIFAALIAAAGVLGLLLFLRGKTGWLLRQRRGRRGTAHWEDRGPTPLGQRRYTPQGLAWAEGKLLFANSWRNRRSRVYELAPGSMQVLRHFDMPDEAVHTSGLAYDSGRLWAVDYISRRAYLIELEESFARGRAVSVGSFDTTLRGASACCLLDFRGRRYLAISDFMNSRRTIFVRPEDALEAKTAAAAIDFSYLNEGCSQGLEYADGYLYESENKLGRDVVNQLDLARLEETASARRSTVRQFPAPGGGVEDLAWDGEAMWTSDEGLFRFFRGRLE